MKRGTRRAAAAGVGLLFSPLIAHSVDLPKLTGMVLDAAVVEEAGSDIRRFEYRLRRAGESSFLVDEFRVDIRSDASRQVLSREGLGFVAPHLANSTRRSLEELGPSGSVAVGVAGAPTSWASGIGPDGFLGWGPLEADAKLPPNATSGNFVMTSRGLPGVRQAFVSHDLWDVLPNADAPGQSAEEIAAAIGDSDQALLTVGPVAPPVELDLGAFAGEIEGYLTTSVQEGWIRDASVAMGLSEHLAALRAALASGNVASAKALSTAFIHEMDANACPTFTCPGEPAITSEGFALMRINMEFLRSKLPNQPPVCHAAEASPDLFWPPSHELIEVEIANVSDPDSDPVAISVQSVLSDEAVDAGGSGNTCPDAVIAADGTLHLRAERAGNSDGRVYEVRYTATDIVGASCGGTVKVCMPHDQSETATCVEGPLDFQVTECP